VSEYNLDFSSASEADLFLGFCASIVGRLAARDGLSPA
jgi:hypothetical protein